MGGSSAINGMMWTRGTINQYDTLEELGNPGWNFASLQGCVPALLLEFLFNLSFRNMKKAEQFRTPDAAQINLGVLFDPDVHGTSGHVVTGFSNPYPCPQSFLFNALINATASVIPNLRTSGDIDLCSGDPRGSAMCILSMIPGTSQGPNVKNNTRSSAAQSYLFSLPPTAKPNLFVLVGHRATRIIWNNVTGQLPRPQGVAFQSQDLLTPAGEMMVNVEREVVVSGGSLGVRNFAFLSRFSNVSKTQSPKFLELSGVGNKT